MYIIHLSEAEYRRLKTLLQQAEQLDRLIGQQDHVTPLHTERDELRATVTQEIQGLIAHSVSEAQVLDACKTALDDLGEWHDATHHNGCNGCITCRESHPMLKDVIHTLTLAQ